jgi:hypothetical protein
VLAALFLFLYWTFDVNLEMQSVGLVLIVVFILLNFICSAIALVLGNTEFLAMMKS